MTPHGHKDEYTTTVILKLIGPILLGIIISIFTWLANGWAEGINKKFETVETSQRDQLRRINRQELELAVLKSEISNIVEATKEIKEDQKLVLREIRDIKK